MVAPAKHLTKFFFLLTTTVCLNSNATTPATHPTETPLEMHVLFAPSAFWSIDNAYLTYELHLTNYNSNSVVLRRIEVLDSDAPASQPIAQIEGGQLNTGLHHIGDKFLGDQLPSADDRSRAEIARGDSVILFLSIKLERKTSIPNQLFHRVVAADSSFEGARIVTHRDKLRVFGPPVKGSNWLASSGPSNESHHRRDVLIMDGRAILPHRYAIDWL